MSLAGANAHMYMALPTPFASQMGSNGPLKDDGSDFPCKGDTTYNRAGITNNWPIGSKQKLA